MVPEDDILKLVQTIKRLMPSARDFWVTWRH